MKIETPHTGQIVVYKMLILCVITVLPMILSLLFKDVAWSYIASIILVAAVFAGFKNLQKSPKKSVDLLQRKKKKAEFETMEFTMRNIEYGVLIVGKMMTVKSVVDGKVRVVSKKMDKKLVKSIEHDPSLVSDPEKLYRQVENLSSKVN